MRWTRVCHNKTKLTSDHEQRVRSRWTHLPQQNKTSRVQVIKRKWKRTVRKVYSNGGRDNIKPAHIAQILDAYEARAAHLSCCTCQRQSSLEFVDIHSGVPRLPGECAFQSCSSCKRTFSGLPKSDFYLSLISSLISMHSGGQVRDGRGAGACFLQGCDDRQQVEALEAVVLEKTSGVRS